ncbi:MAG TPA: hypothetical protein VI956_05400 [Nitrospirota bacterium]|nr:hypothetical protein [Nitrospirota bacterium]
MKTINRIICVVVLLVVGFAAGFPIGSTIGFTRGSEWAIVQADVIARESGLFMPIGFDGGMFRVIMKQPRGLYKKVWQQADKHDKRFDDMKGMNKPVVTANDVVFASDGEKTF